MRLTTFSDYALRLLMFAAAAGDRLVTIEEASRRYAISRAHLMKVANELTRAGFLTAVRGRSGGLKLGRPAVEIKVGEVVRVTEPDFAMVECFTTGNRCVITELCRLPRALDAATKSYLDTLDRYTLADIVPMPMVFASAIDVSDAGKAKAGSPVGP
jgi:Rrf2 family transcriptional regulator, nitric oxide-sensitive transcriptional repressor